MFARLCASPVFLLIGLLLTLSGVFMLTLTAERLLFGAGLLLTGSVVVYLSQSGAVRKSVEISRPGQTQK